MKANFTIAERNAVVERCVPLIDREMDCHRDIIKAARMEREDVYQQLAERLICAVDAYVPAKGTLEDYLETQLERELFNCAHPRRLYGMTDAPLALRKNRVVSLDTMREYAAEREYETDGVAA